MELEALLRWDHPSGRQIPPDRFIRVAEQSGLIVALGRFVVASAVRDLQVLDAELGPIWQPAVSVNLSARQLADPGLVAFVGAMLSDAGLANFALRFEITETALLADDDAAGATIGGLRALGSPVVIDDFGTGYSALDYLKRFPIDGIKIDRSFVAGLGRPGPDDAIVTASIAFARALGLEVTAEGIETPGQLRWLIELGCDRGQGFLLGRPAPLADLLPVMRSQRLQLRSIAPVGPRRSPRGEGLVAG